MSRKRERFFILTGVVVFFLSISGFTAVVIWQMIQDGNNQSSSENNGGDKVDNQKQLAGTKLEDFEPQQEVAELKTIDIQQGNGSEAKAGDTVTVDYTGAVAATGIIFQSSVDSGQPVTLGLDQVIDGWKEGIPGMKIGGKRRIIIPAEKAYGANPPAGSGIPANAPLVFDVTLYAIGE